MLWVNRKYAKSVAKYAESNYNCRKHNYNLEVYSMGTQQALTTKQMEFLTTIYSIEEFAKDKEITTSIDEMLICNFGYTEDEYDELTEALRHYGYIDDSVKLTIDGKIAEEN